MNKGYLNRDGVNAMVTWISVEVGNDTALVQVPVNLDRLFTGVVPDVTVIETA